MLKADEQYLSVNWLEHTGASSRAKQLAIVRKHLAIKRTLAAKERLAVLHLQTVFDHVKTKTRGSHTLKAHHEPEPEDPSHSGIYGYSHEDQLIAELVAQAVQEHYPARG